MSRVPTVRLTPASIAALAANSNAREARDVHSRATTRMPQFAQGSARYASAQPLVDDDFFDDAQVVAQPAPCAPLESLELPLAPSEASTRQVPKLHRTPSMSIVPAVSRQAPDVDELVADRYSLRRRLPGTGELFAARDTLIEREVVIRLAPSSSLPSLLLEANAVSSVAAPALAQIHDCGNDEANAYLVYEAPAGLPLTEALAGTPCEPMRALAIVRQVLHALTALHQLGVVQGGVRCEQVWLRATDDVTICGLTNAARPPRASAGFAEGVAADLESCVRLFIGLLDGGFEFTAERLGGLALPAPYVAVVRRAISADPAQRFASAPALTSALITATQQVVGGRAEPATRHPVVQMPVLRRGPRPSWRWPAAAIALATTLTAICYVLV